MSSSQTVYSPNIIIVLLFSWLQNYTCCDEACDVVELETPKSSKLCHKTEPKLKWSTMSQRKDDFVASNSLRHSLRHSVYISNFLLVNESGPNVCPWPVSRFKFVVDSVSVFSSLCRVSILYLFLFFSLPLKRIGSFSHTPFALTQIDFISFAVTTPSFYWRVETSFSR